MTGRMQKIEFMTPNLTSKPSGGNTEALVVALTTFAYMRPTSSNRTFLNEEGVLINSYNFDVQYRDSFTPTKSHIIRYRNKLYAINGITNVRERRRYWRIFAIEQE